jgi:hypothetical protein
VQQSVHRRRFTVPANKRPQPTPSERAQRCTLAADLLWERCERGVEYVYPPANTKITPSQQRDAARLLIKLMRAADRLIATAERNDRSAVEEWLRRREALYLRRGWTWPMSDEERAETKHTAAHLSQLAFGSDQRTQANTR